jgi:hypothetical protein
MGDGVVQLLFIVAVLVASVFDAVGRNRKRKQQEEDQRAAEEDGPMDWGAAEEGAWGEPEAPAPAGPRRSSAEDLLPPDLWAILTGQPPRQADPSGSPEQAGSRASEPAHMPSSGAPPAPIPAPVAPSIPHPTGETRPGDGSGGTPTRRSSRWMEGVSEADRPRGAESTVAAGSMPRRTTTRAASAASGRDSAPGAVQGEPWGGLPDITAGEIGAAPAPGAPGARRGALTGRVRGPGRRGTGSAAAGFQLVGGSVSSLRSAIILREVLGPPLGGQDLDRSPRDRG